MPAHKPHWYYLTYSFCPVCGGGQIYRERRYGERPKNWQDRIEHRDAYDWCIEYGNL